MLRRTRGEESSPATTESGTRERIGPYRIVRELGRGGMGVVYAAEDERLHRPVALKTIGAGSGDAHDRLWREARAAAGMNHPGICQVFDVIEEGGQLWVAMELLEGQPLDEVLAGGRLGVDRAIEIGLEILKPLGFLHEQALVHRDLKPSNIFLTPVGLKLLDFGLTRGSDDTIDSTLTQTTAIVGTPRYMAPEQWRAKDVGPWSDLFSFGAMLYEMLSGQYAFEGDDPIDIFHAAAHEQPPPLTGALGIEAIDKVVRRSIAKEPRERYASANELSEVLSTAYDRMRALESTGSREAKGDLAAATVQRLIALPFRMLRPDPEIDFLSTSLPEAIGTSLSGLKHLVIRSTQMAGEDAERDLKKLASEMEVDYALSGTLMSGGSKVRLNAQLLQVPSGTVVWSTQEQAEVDDLFHLHDDLTNKIVEGLQIPLSPEEEERLHRAHDVDPRAYELYLRGLALLKEVRATVMATTGLNDVKNVLKQSVDIDGSFAPAWAVYARTCRLLSKYFTAESDENREQARVGFERAFEVEPRSPIAHNYYTYYQLEELADPTGAMLRLLELVADGSTDANYWAGLVPAFRFLGLYKSSFAAHERALSFSPKIGTGVIHTHLQTGDYQYVVDHATDAVVIGSALATLGRTDEALALLRADSRRSEGLRVAFYGSILAALEGRTEDCAKHCRAAMESSNSDPEATYFFARVAGYAGLTDTCLEIMTATLDDGYASMWIIDNDPWLDLIRDEPAFVAGVEKARALHREGLAALRRVGGERLLDVQETEL